MHVSVTTRRSSYLGGTVGCCKVIRLVLFIKQAGRETRHLIHPSAEVPIKIENKVVPDAVVYAIGGFFSVYIGATILLTCIMIGTGLDPLTALSAVAGDRTRTRLNSSHYCASSMPSSP